LKHQAFYDRIAEETICKRFEKNKPLILYAPTWNNQENPTSFFSATETIVKELSPDFNLAIKLHPFLIEYHPAHAYAMMGCYEQHPSAQFIIDFPPIYPLLAKSTCYIGDYSSIGYDFLAFDRPLFFLPTGPTAAPSYRSPLYACGTTIHPEDLPRIHHIISKGIEQADDSYSHIRKETYLYAFGEERPCSRLYEDIFQALKR
jgi:CDP-glycerol glycerophosphotransferase (TagB/SpsB family)